MVQEDVDPPGRLGLRAGELVEVRSAAEILATLGPTGTLDGLPFMPEMLQYCGRRLRVFKRADKTCDTIGRASTHSLRMLDAVHLEDVRCDGAAHDGCQAECLLFWKEVWLKRPANDDGPGTDSAMAGAPGAPAVPEPPALLQAAARRRPEAGEAPDTTYYVCQATELERATAPLPWWSPGQYLRELRSGNVDLWTFLRVVARASFNAFQRWHGGRRFPRVEPKCEVETPVGAPLNLQPGELVRIRSKEEIFATLNRQSRNRGLYFDVEMVPFCGRTARVRQRVQRIIDEKSGRMLRLTNPCIMLDGVVCSGCLSRERLFCPRSIPSYWREIWLERLSPESAAGRQQETAEAAAEPAGEANAAAEPPRASAVSG
jgi:hypothetical protein